MKKLYRRQTEKQYLIPDKSSRWENTVGPLELHYLFVEKEAITVGQLKLQYLIPDVFLDEKLLSEKMLK